MDISLINFWSAKPGELRENFGADELMCHVHLGNVATRESVLQSMRVLTDKVIPKVK